MQESEGVIAPAAANAPAASPAAGVPAASPAAGSAAASSAAAGASAAANTPAASPAAGSTAASPAAGSTAASTAAPVAAPDFIVARNLGLRTIKGSVFENVNANIKPGELVCLFGPNGSGKSALLLTLAGRMVHSKGTLTIDGQPMPKKRSKVLHKVGLGVFANINDLQEGLSVTEVASNELDAARMSSNKASCAEYLRAWNLDHLAKQKVEGLTSMDYARLCVALAFVRNPTAVVIDDVQTGFNMDESRRFVSYLKDLSKQRNAAIIFSTSESELADMADVRINLSERGE